MKNEENQWVATDTRGNKHVVVQGDCLHVLRSIPDASVSLILTDPPYHSTKKKNITGDTNFAQDADFIAWMETLAKEWKRVLKPNGSLLCFCSSAMAASLEVMFSRYFNILSQIVWTKPNLPGYDGWKQKMNKQALRQWYPHSERIIFAEPSFPGTLGKSFFASFLREYRKKSGLSGHELTEIIGEYGKVNHGGAVSNWETGRNIPSRIQYDKISKAFSDISPDLTLPPYEDTIRPFFMSRDKSFTDIWSFPSVRPYKGKHPAEKPQEMLREIVESTTYENGVVLDCFGGSGSTSIAAMAMQRASITIDIDCQWAPIIAKRVRLAASHPCELLRTLNSMKDVDKLAEQKLLL